MRCIRLHDWTPFHEVRSWGGPHLDRPSSLTSGGNVGIPLGEIAIGGLEDGGVGVSPDQYMGLAPPETTVAEAREWSLWSLAVVQCGPGFVLVCLFGVCTVGSRVSLEGSVQEPPGLLLEISGIGGWSTSHGRLA